MIHLIANKIVTELQELEWVDHITGIVKPAKLIVDNVTKTFPIAYNVNPTNCSQSELLAFVPDSTKRSIVYFEDYGTTLNRMENQMLYWTSNFRLICWFNYKKLTPAMTDPSLVALNILNVIPAQLGNFDGLIGVWVVVNGQLPNDAAIFGRYSYKEEKTQYITYPYDYVAFSLTAEYGVRTQCVDEIENITPVC